MSWSIHPADWAAMDSTERTTAVILGTAETGPHWIVARVAELCGLDARTLEEHVELERGWEPHDDGYRSRVVESAGMLLAGSEEGR